METIKAAYGTSYRMMMEEIDTTFKNYETLFPTLKGKKLEIAGFVWFQRWNDMYNGAEKEYVSNMKHIIKDVRKDLKSPKMPFVIGVMGQNGSKPAKGAMVVVKEAQASMESVAEFKGNVKAVQTDVIIDKAAGLTTIDNQSPRSFWLAGKDKKWLPATAKIKGNTIVLINDQISQPLFVRYAFVGVANTNLVNAAKLPALPFRTDSFKP